MVANNVLYVHLTHHRRRQPVLHVKHVYHEGKSSGVSYGYS